MTKRTPDRTSSAVHVKPKPIESVQTEKSGQAFLFSPSELRACGLRDAHTHPLVGKRTAAGVRSWRTSPPRAWAWPLVEWNRTGNSYAAIGFDCDSRDAVERAAASCMAGGDLPTPNVYATRTASGHAQVFYLLERPVHRGEHARATPLRYLARVSEFYRASLGADAGYTGVLASNPVHDDYQTSYPRTDPYALADLASVIPSRWRVPRPATTAEGRNCEVFRALCKRGLQNSDSQLEAFAHTYNDQFVPPVGRGRAAGHPAERLPLPVPVARTGTPASLSLATSVTGAQGRQGVRCGAAGWHATRGEPGTVGRSGCQ